VFLVSGLWHGANYTFIIWGALHGLYLIVGILTADFQKKYLPRFAHHLFTIILVMFAWIFFRSENLGHAIQYISDIFKNPGSFLQIGIYLKYKTIILLIALFILIEWIGRDHS
jgi:D-alanyl-lipoteichoic acid acyltransferase DltB (MBOAT superfamily)